LVIVLVGAGGLMSIWNFEYTDLDTIVGSMVCRHWCREIDKPTTVPAM